MSETNILFPIIGLTATLVAINYLQNKKVKENFGMLPSFQTKVDVEVAPNAKAAAEGKFQSVQNKYQTMLNPQKAFYTVPSNFQSNLAPRFFGGDYGANISYNLPSQQNLAVPQNPLDLANTAADLREGFCVSGSCGQKNTSVVSCNKGGAPTSYSGGAPLMQANYTDGNYQQKANELYSKPSSLKATHNALPVGDMTQLNSLGQVNQPIVYDRYMFANRNSRLRSGGDPIRGDIAITPNAPGWFRPSVQPNIDLQQGAMNVLGGVNNETAQQLADLIYTTSGRSQTAIGGVNMEQQLANPAKTIYPTRRTNTMNYNSEPLNSVNMSNRYGTQLSAANSDINVTAFP
jgi:hypothetical protein